MLNIHVYPSLFKFESRILKETKSIIDLDLATAVIIFSKGESRDPVTEIIGDRISVYRIKTVTSSLPRNKVTQGLFYIEFFLRFFFISLRYPVRVINCHSLMVLPVSVFIKWVKRARLIYDPHELETESIGLRGMAQKVSKIAERFFIRWVDSIIVVTDRN